MDIGLTLVVGLIFGLWAISRIFPPFEKGTLTGEISSHTTQITERDRRIERLRTKLADLGRLKQELEPSKDVEETYMGKVAGAGKYKHFAIKAKENIREMEQRIEGTGETPRKKEKEREQQAAQSTPQQQLLQQLYKAQAHKTKLNEDQPKEIAAGVEEVAEAKKKEEVASGQDRRARLARRATIRPKDRMPERIWAVQVHAFSHERNARNTAEKLKDKGYNTYVVSARVKGRTWYRVQVGRLDTQEEAEELQAKLRKREKYTKAWIVALGLGVANRRGAQEVPGIERHENTCRGCD